MNIQGTEFDRGDLAREIAARYGDDLDNAQTQEAAVLVVLAAIPVVLAEALAEFGRVEIHDLGTFSLQNRQRSAGNDESGNPVFEPTGYDKIAFRSAPLVETLVTSVTGRPVE